MVAIAAIHLAWRAAKQDLERDQMWPALKAFATMMKMVGLVRMRYWFGIHKTYVSEKKIPCLLQEMILVSIAVTTKKRMEIAVWNVGLIRKRITQKAKTKRRKRKVKL